MSLVANRRSWSLCWELRACVCGSSSGGSPLWGSGNHWGGLCVRYRIKTTGEYDGRLYLGIEGLWCRVNVGLDLWNWLNNTNAFCTYILVVYYYYLKYVYFWYIISIIVAIMSLLFLNILHIHKTFGLLCLLSCNVCCYPLCCSNGGNFSTVGSSYLLYS